MYTHIDDMVESMRVVTPTGRRSRVAGCPDPARDRRPIGCSSGSEGSLGIITEAWMRVQDRPVFKGSAGMRFADFGAAVDATRAVAQSGAVPHELPAARSG